MRKPPMNRKAKSRPTRGTYTKVDVAMETALRGQIHRISEAAAWEMAHKIFDRYRWTEPFPIPVAEIEAFILSLFPPSTVRRADSLSTHSWQEINLHRYLYTGQGGYTHSFFELEPSGGIFHIPVSGKWRLRGIVEHPLLVGESDPWFGRLHNWHVRACKVDDTIDEAVHAVTQSIWKQEDPRVLHRVWPELATAVGIQAGRRRVPASAIRQAHDIVHEFAPARGKLNEFIARCLMLPEGASTIWVHYT